MKVPRRLARAWTAVSLAFGCLETAVRAAESGAVLIERENIVDWRPASRGWQRAEPGLKLASKDRMRTGELSRATLRFGDLSLLRVDELTDLEVREPTPVRTLEVERGGIYLLNRGRPQQFEFRTPAVNGALRGTEFALRVAAGGRTVLTMFEGEVELRNAHGRVLLRSGEQGEAEAGSAPRKTARIDAINSIQWCLYYPAVLDPAELTDSAGLDAAASLYRGGDLLGAMRSLVTRPGSDSTGRKVFRAATILAVGQVAKARRILAGVPASHPGRNALERMIDAVQFRGATANWQAHTASEWLAESYHRQSRGNLEGARVAARTATELSPDFGFAWARLAELEFSFGRTLPAMKLMERALELSPRNAQAVALQGFLLAAENRNGSARRSFEHAITLDGALGNAWLGRGLTANRQGRDEEGLHDIQVAAVLEPQRSILRSYLGKALSDIGPIAKAIPELERAKELDPADPTPWLYSAIERQRENRPNEAIGDTEKSIALNDERRLYRSQFLLDQDRAVRNANLAAIYRQAGLAEQSVREAVRAVSSDYTSAPAHLFLSSSYDALRDPTRILLRYETAWFNELLIANLLAPVGAGSLSQFVSQQEYSKLFEQDGIGFSTVAEYRGDGQLRAIGSLFGTAGNVSYALDADYLYSDGQRPNNDISRFEGYATFKLQLGPQDTLLLQTKFGETRAGDVFQRYDPRSVSYNVGEVPDPTGGTRKVKTPNTAAQTFRLHEDYAPEYFLLGWHREWSPGNHTLLLLEEFGGEQRISARDAGSAIVFRDISALAPPGLDGEVQLGTQPRDGAFFKYTERFTGQGIITRYQEGSFDLDSQIRYATFGAELQQIFVLGPATTVLGGRYQTGEFETRSRLTDFNNSTQPEEVALFRDPPADQEFTNDFQRLSLYLYETWRATPWLAITGGISWDHLERPANFRLLPVADDEKESEHVSPKIGAILQPWRGATIRAAYSEALSGTSFDQSVRLEPSQVAGMLQAYRTIVPESLTGSTDGARHRFSGISLEQKLPTRTYLGVEWNSLAQNSDRTIGVFDLLDDFGTILAVLPSSLDEKLQYREESLVATAHQLFGQHWAVGARYRYTHSELIQELDGFGRALRATQDPTAIDDLSRKSRSHAESILHELSLQAFYQHPSGFFARAEANWYRQENDDYVVSGELFDQDENFLFQRKFKVRNRGLPDEDFWQFNAFAGYRFARNRAEISAGVLNFTGADYRLTPLSPYPDLVRDRTVVVRARFEF